MGTQSSHSRASLVPLFKELTAKSAICLLLGLAIWFSKTEPLAFACGFLLPLLLSTSRLYLNRGAVFFIRGRFFCQAPFLRSFAASPRFGNPRQCFGLPSFEGRRLLLPCRVSCQPCRFRLYFFCVPPNLRPALGATSAAAFPVEGRGFYHHRVLSQPPSSTLYSLCQPSLQRLSFVRLPSGRGAASTTAAFGVNP